jgi:hypothetical protein
MSYIHLLYDSPMSLLGSEKVRRSFDADVVFFDIPDTAPLLRSQGNHIVESTRANHSLVD